MLTPYRLVNSKHIGKYLQVNTALTSQKVWIFTWKATALGKLSLL